MPLRKIIDSEELGWTRDRGIIPSTLLTKITLDCQCTQIRTSSNTPTYRAKCRDPRHKGAQG